MNSYPCEPYEYMPLTCMYTTHVKIQMERYVDKEFRDIVMTSSVRLILTLLNEIQGRSNPSIDNLQSVKTVIKSVVLILAAHFLL